MIDDDGNLSIDFLVGFTIFMITLIYVATLIPTLFIGLQSNSIDYDAVAYRTGVILAEDPGMPYNPSWETLPNISDSEILRFGLALSKDTPNILTPEKINRFFLDFRICLSNRLPVTGSFRGLPVPVQYISADGRK